jgi:hypothetical protein
MSVRLRAGRGRLSQCHPMWPWQECQSRLGLNGVPLGSDSACGAGAGPTGLPVLTEIGCGGSAWITGLGLPGRFAKISVTACSMLFRPTPCSRGTLRFVREKTRPGFTNLAPEVSLSRLIRLRLRSGSGTEPVLRACQAGPRAIDSVIRLVNVKG